MCFCFEFIGFSVQFVCVELFVCFVCRLLCLFAINLLISSENRATRDEAIVNELTIIMNVVVDVFVFEWNVEYNFQVIWNDLNVFLIHISNYFRINELINLFGTLFLRIGLIPFTESLPWINNPQRAHLI